MVYAESPVDVKHSSRKDRSQPTDETKASNVLVPRYPWGSSNSLARRVGQSGYLWLREDRGHGSDARRRQAAHAGLPAGEAGRAAADHPPADALRRRSRCARGARRVPQGPGRRRLHLRLPGHPRPVQVRGEVRHDPAPRGRRASPRPSTRGPTPTTRSTGWSRT